MDQALLKRLVRLIDQLALPVSQEEASYGWTARSKAGIEKFFRSKLAELEQGSAKTDYGLVRGLDAWGISDGSLYDEALRVNMSLGK